MDIEDVNLSADSFLLSTSSAENKNNKGKKRTLTENDEQMQIDDISGIEGKPKTDAQKPKRKKQSSLELRKIAVPPYR